MALVALEISHAEIGRERISTEHAFRHHVAPAWKHAALRVARRCRSALLSTAAAERASCTLGADFGDRTEEFAVRRELLGL